MIKTKKFGSIESVLNKLAEDKKYVLIRHELKKGEEVKEHSHDIDELVILKTGSFVVGCNGETREYNLRNDVHVVFYPSGSKHSLKNTGRKLNYFVLRLM